MDIHNYKRRLERTIKRLEKETGEDRKEYSEGKNK